MSKLQVRTNSILINSINLRSINQSMQIFRYAQPYQGNKNSRNIQKKFCQIPSKCEGFATKELNITYIFLIRIKQIRIQSSSADFLRSRTSGITARPWISDQVSATIAESRGSYVFLFIIFKVIQKQGKTAIHIKVYRLLNTGTKLC